MKKISVLLILCLMSVTAQAGPLGLVDNFNTPGMAAYTQTVVLETTDPGATYDTIFQDPAGELQANLPVFPGIEQALCLRDDYSLGVGEMLIVDVNWVQNGVSQDLGLAVSATKNPPAGGPRQNFVTMCMRGDNNHVYSCVHDGADGTPGYAYSWTQAWPGNVSQLYIARTDPNTFDVGYNAGHGWTSLAIWDVANTDDIGNAIGFYSDMRAVNVIGNLDNLKIVPEPATIALLGLGGLALLRRKRA